MLVLNAPWVQDVNSKHKCAVTSNLRGQSDIRLPQFRAASVRDAAQILGCGTVLRS